MGQRLRDVPIRAFFQILEDATDPLVLPRVDLAPDGLATFSTTARFGGVSNSLTGTGVTAAAVKADFFSAITRWKNMLHTDSKTPLVDDSLLDEITLFAPTGLLEAFKDAFIRTLVVDSGGDAAPSNTIIESGFKINMHFTTYLTDVNDWYLFLPKAKHKAIVMGGREGLITREFDSSNSSEQAKIFESFFLAAQRWGFTSNLPWPALRITNT